MQTPIKITKKLEGNHMKTPSQVLYQTEIGCLVYRKINAGGHLPGAHLAMKKGGL